MRERDGEEKRESSGAKGNSNQKVTLQYLCCSHKFAKQQPQAVSFIIVIYARTHTHSRSYTAIFLSRLCSMLTFFSSLLSFFQLFIRACNKTNKQNSNIIKHLCQRTVEREWTKKARAHTPHIADRANGNDDDDDKMKKAMHIDADKISVYMKKEKLPIHLHTY